MTVDIDSSAPLYKLIYSVVCQIPPGKVATYGQIAKMVGHCTPRMAGYALSSLRAGSDVPWQRVINRQGKISPHGDGIGTALQRQLLVDEGICFDQQGRVDFSKVRWLSSQDDH